MLAATVSFLESFGDCHRDAKRQVIARRYESFN